MRFCVLDFRQLKPQHNNLIQHYSLLKFLFKHSTLIFMIPNDPQHIVIFHVCFLQNMKPNCYKTLLPIQSNPLLTRLYFAIVHLGNVLSNLSHLGYNNSMFTLKHHCLSLQYHICSFLNSFTYTSIFLQCTTLQCAMYNPIKHTITSEEPQLSTFS